MSGVARIAVVISGSGRNLQAILAACADGRLAAQVVLVLSNRADAYGLERARAAGVPTAVLPHPDFPSREAFDAALAQRLEHAQPDAVALAGFMRILTPAFIARFEGRMLNIHPSLLPKYPGLHTHRRALAAGDAEHGATVHFVTDTLDGGPAIVQGRVAVHSGESEAALAERVMSKVERHIYPLALGWLLSGRLQLRDGSCWLDGAPLQQALSFPAECRGG